MEAFLWQCIEIKCDIENRLGSASQKNDAGDRPSPRTKAQSKGKETCLMRMISKENERDRLHRTKVIHCHILHEHFSLRIDVLFVQRDGTKRKFLYIT